MDTPALPIDPLLPQIVATLARDGRAVLQAPPGAGKTTRVPLALMQAGVPGRVLMLEPRRIAARAAAERMAATLGEAKVGGTVGYRIRGEARTSRATRIEVVTEGILTRMLQDDPGLDGVGAVIFDEFHERSLQSDLGLALLWESRGALRPELQLLVMSATLDAAPVAALLDDAPVLTAEGRSFPVETRWLDTPVPAKQRFEVAVADLVLRAVAETEGGVLVFLPGEGEIRRCTAALEGRLPAGMQPMPLYGALPAAAQRAALAPLAQGRKLVLATAIAETALTIPDIRVVVDGGRARRPRFDPGSGMSRLVTGPVSRAEATQRQGRAGRVAPGVCYRLWTRGAEGALPAHPPAEIEAADLASLALDLALWGAAPEDLAFLTPPPAPALAEARKLLQGLEALSPDGRITDHGSALAAMPLHPRLAHMLVRAGAPAAPLAALLEGRDPLRGAPADLVLRLRALDGQGAGADPGALAALRQEARRLARQAGPGPRPALDAGSMAALAYPDRIALRRPGKAPRYLMSGGKGARLDEADPLASQRLLVVTDSDGDPREARIRQAAVIAESAVRDLYGGQIETVAECDWDSRTGRVAARLRERLGALALSDRIWPDPPAEARATAALNGLRDLGLAALKPGPGFARLRARIALARQVLPELPPVDDAALLDTAADWLGPALAEVRAAADFAALDAAAALEAWLGWERMRALDRVAPAVWESPLGRKLPVDYAGEAPAIEARVQELFGTAAHPVLAGQPLRVTLLSPAGRPVQTTMDLPGFWAGSYAEVRKEMRARYPKHLWPEDPTAADPTLRAKPRR